MQLLTTFQAHLISLQSKVLTQIQTKKTNAQLQMKNHLQLLLSKS